MAKLNMEFSQNETEYSDGEIENKLLEICKNHAPSEFDDIISENKSWPVLYHLSRYRQNILNWYPFKEGAEILEVGAGCGAITGLLCEKGQYVIAAELTKIRSQINYERNKNYDNLDIYVGDIFKMRFDRKFDYITLIGVLEYAAFMSKAKNPYAEMLSKLKDLLKPDGHILIAIENRYGLKYFAGAREDHTGGFFDGVDGYSKDSKVRTFTRGELEALLDSQGLTTRKFYYPLPDYKFTKAVYSDKTINNFNTSLNFRAYDSKRFNFFDEQSTMEQLSKEGVLGTFANSFFIDIGPQTGDILTEWMSVQRREDYRIITRLENINGKCAAIKQPLTKASETHVLRMYENYRKYKKMHGFELAQCRPVNGCEVKFDFIEGKKLSKHLENLLREKDKDGFLKTLDWYYSRLLSDTELTDNFYSEEFLKTFGSEKLEMPLHCGKVSNVDMNFDNIIMNGQDAKIIDYEWILEIPVPVEYIFYRNFVYNKFIAENKELLKELMERYHISEKMGEVFYSWELHFLYRFAKSLDMSFFAQPKKRLSREKFEECLSERTFESTMFYDIGNGFNENNKIKTADVKDGCECEFTYNIENSSKIKALRFDPLEGLVCCCKIISAVSNSGKVDVIPVNSACSTENGDLFLTEDPVYSIKCDFEKAEWVKIKFAVYTKIDDKILYSMQNYLKRLNFDISSLENSNRILNSQYDAVINSNSWKITKPLRKLKQIFDKSK